MCQLLLSTNRTTPLIMMLHMLIKFIYLFFATFFRFYKCWLFLLRFTSALRATFAVFGTTAITTTTAMATITTTTTTFTIITTTVAHSLMLAAIHHWPAIPYNGRRFLCPRLLLGRPLDRLEVPRFLTFCLGVNWAIGGSREQRNFWSDFDEWRRYRKREYLCI